MVRKFYFDDKDIELIISALSEYEDNYHSQLADYDKLPDYERETYEEAYQEVLDKFNLILSIASYISGAFPEKYARKFLCRFHFDE